MEEEKTQKTRRNWMILKKEHEETGKKQEETGKKTGRNRRNWNMPEESVRKSKKQ